MLFPENQQKKEETKGKRIKLPYFPIVSLIFLVFI